MTTKKLTSVRIDNAYITMIEVLQKEKKLTGADIIRDALKQYFSTVVADESLRKKFKEAFQKDK